jgi:hypothetical protein
MSLIHTHILIYLFLYKCWSFSLFLFICINIKSLYFVAYLCTCLWLYECRTLKWKLFMSTVKLYGEKKNLWSLSASELCRPSDRRLSAKLVPTFEDGGCRVVSGTDPYGRILGFLDRSRYFFLLSSFSIVLMRLNGPRSRPSTSQKIG